MPVITRFTTDHVAAFEAPVTEIAFFTLPSDSGEDSKATVEKTIAVIRQAVESVGKSKGSAIGWREFIQLFLSFLSRLRISNHPVVAEPTKHPEAPNLGAVTLHGVFGYESVEDHIKWRETPEHGQAIKAMGELAKTLDLKSATVYGKEMFHVQYHLAI